MELSDKTKAVNLMQQYITNHIDEPITLNTLTKVTGYSKYHAVRIFKELTHKTPLEYIRAIRLTKAAQTLCNSDKQVVDVALNSGFDSHDGFTRAFTRQFNITPHKYQQETPAVSWFVYRPIEAYFALKEGSKPMPKELMKRTLTVTAVERPARKLILVRSIKATNYLDYCEEMGCDWEGLLDSIREKYDSCAWFSVPPSFAKTGTGNYACGVEVPLEYSRSVPSGCDMVILSPCILLYMQTSPYEDENGFGEAHGILAELSGVYNPMQYGWEYADELAPAYTFSAHAKTGARMARPVRKT